VTDDQPQPPDKDQEQPDSREGQPGRPLLRVVTGDATPEEVAALVAVIASLSSDAAPPSRRTPEWSAHHRKARVSLPHGPGGWRSSGLPH
jgi:acyl-CoA carboxylase epsilon subunit